MENYYNLFEVSPDADLSLIRSAFRKKAKSCHPDLFQHVSAEERKRRQKKFVRLTQAYETLADPEKRRIFDRQLGKTGTKSQQPHDQNNRRSSSFSSARSGFKEKTDYPDMISVSLLLKIQLTSLRTKLLPNTCSGLKDFSVYSASRAPTAISARSCITGSSSFLTCSAE